MTTTTVTAALRVAAAIHGVAHVLNEREALAVAERLRLGWDSLAVGCVSEGARYRRIGEVAVYEWADGSAIVEEPSGHWAVRVPGCRSAYHEGSGCQCWREVTP